MKLVEWFKDKFKHAPANRVVEVTCRDDAVELSWPQSPNETVLLNDIQRIVIRNTDQGPFDEDVFFCLETDEDTFVIPQGADGVSELLERLQQFPGFNNEALIESMGCTDNRLFVCWERVPTT